MKNRPHTDILKQLQGALFKKNTVSVHSIEEPPSNQIRLIGLESNKTCP